ncbi:MAG: GTP cyclohydrolase II [Crocinitomicaceae bacterium]|nr:GTP cyclohydrolase II [Crocinitomicaceae bacterium]|tara:strand:+ start:539 stop:1129 length:591 start_codon:yes stop_codon:yes gene_type:complete
MKPIVESRLPTKFGGFKILAFESIVSEMPTIVLVSDKFDPNSKDAVEVRIHSECMTGDVFSSSRCDCGEQLDTSLMKLQQDGGILIYLRQEGRGIGLIEKLKAYNLQDDGLDTYEANVNLGHPEDARSFETAVEVLKYLGVKRIKLLTNNPDKVRAFDLVESIEVLERIPLQVGVVPENKEYIEAKHFIKGHYFKI